MSDVQNEEVKETVESETVDNVEAENLDNVEAENLNNVEELNASEAPEEVKEEDFKNKYFYLAAEFENTRRRSERERENLIKFGNEKILKSLLDIVDNLDRTISAVATEEDEKIKNIVTGLDMVKGQFVGVLKQNGLEEIEALGKQFDPNFHEALAQQPAEGVDDNEIINEFQKGYILNGRLLRATKVVIAKN